MAFMFCNDVKKLLLPPEDGEVERKIEDYNFEVVQTLIHFMVTPGNT
jgi:hypothetical protein